MVLAALLSACRVAAVDLGEDDVLVAGESASATTSNLELMKVSESMAVDEDIRTLSISQARARVIADARARLTASVRPARCASVESDGTSFVEIEYDDCRLGLFGLIRLSGSWRAEVSFESEACDQGECISAAVFEVSTAGFTLSGWRGQRSVETSGTWRVTDPVEPGEPSRYQGNTRLSSEAGTLLSSLDATWTRDAEGCLHASFDAQMSIDAREDLRQVTQSGMDLVRCGDLCPRAGSMQLSYASGSILQWEYNGSAEVIVSAPGGATRRVELPCESE